MLDTIEYVKNRPAVFIDINKLGYSSPDKPYTRTHGTF